MEQNSFKLVIFTENEPHFVLPVVTRICKELEGSVSVVALVVSKKFGNRSFKRNLKRFYPLVRLKGMLLTLMDKAIRSVGAVLHLNGSCTLNSISKQLNIPLLVTKDVNSAEVQKKLESLNADLFVSISFGQIFKGNIIEIPRMGLINLHSSLLPEYRGLMPNFWVLANGEKETGITVHYVDAGIDTGRIIKQERFNIEPGTTYYELLKKSKLVGGTALISVIRIMSEGNDIETISPDRKGTYYGFPSELDFNAFWNKGLRYR